MVILSHHVTAMTISIFIPQGEQQTVRMKAVTVNDSGLSPRDIKHHSILPTSFCECTKEYIQGIDALMLPLPLSSTCPTTSSSLSPTHHPVLSSSTSPSLHLLHRSPPPPPLTSPLPATLSIFTYSRAPCTDDMANWSSVPTGHLWPQCLHFNGPEHEKVPMLTLYNISGF